MLAAIYLYLHIYYIFLFSEASIKDTNIKCVDVYFSLPYIELSNDKVTAMSKSISNNFSIFYSSNFILYKLPYNFSEQHNDSVILSERRFTYFIHKYGNSEGYNFNPTKVDNPEKFNVDSFLIGRAFAKIDFYPEKSYNLYTAIPANDNFQLTEKYITKNIGLTSPDTLIYYYSDQLKDLQFSFSKKLEDIKQLKILKIRGIYKSRFDEEYKITLPYRELYFELKSNNTMQDSIVNSIFNLFEKKNN